MAAKVVTTHPPTHSPAQQGEPTQSVFRRRNCDSLFPQGSSEAKKQQLQVEHLGFKMFTSRMIRVGLYCWFNTSLLCKFAFTWKLCGQCEKIQDHSEKRVFYPPKNLELQLDTFNKIERKNLPLEKFLLTNVFWHLRLDTFDNLIERKTFDWILRAFAHHPSPSLWSGRARGEMLELERGKMRSEKIIDFYVVWEWNWIYNLYVYSLIHSLNIWT